MFRAVRSATKHITQAHEVAGYQTYIHHSGRNGEQSTVETVERTAMSGQETPTVLDAELTFELAFHKVTPRAERAPRKAKAVPEQQTSVVHKTVETCGTCQHGDATTHAADPRLVG